MEGIADSIPNRTTTTSSLSFLIDRRSLSIDICLSFTLFLFSHPFSNFVSDEW